MFFEKNKEFLVIFGLKKNRRVWDPANAKGAGVICFGERVTENPGKQEGKGGTGGPSLRYGVLPHLQPLGFRGLA
jgi:hypothetical protein